MGASTARPAESLGASARRLGATALELLRVRLELLDAEWAAEKARLGTALIVGGLAAGLALLALATGGVLAVLSVDEDSRMAALATLAGVYLLMAAGAAWWAWRSLRPTGGALPLSRGELERDAAAMRGETQ